ncbi:MAG: hypothetical protein KTR31_40110 [Myxococcales bacterium]|nr:hypothetical protein [Myxococcales bacterium]
MVTLAHVEGQSSARYEPRYRTHTLGRYVKLILYHSVFSVVLDPRGEPTTLPRGSQPKARGSGLQLRGSPAGDALDYPILLPEPGKNLMRYLPRPGFYVATRQVAGGAFRVDGVRLTKVRGLGSMTMQLVTGEFVHPLQERIQAHIDASGPSMVAALVAPRAQRKLTRQLLKQELPKVAAAIIEPAVRLVIRLARHHYDNWQALVQEIGAEALREAVKERVREKVVDYAIKKLAVNLMPVINLASSVYDLWEGSENKRIRHALAAMLMALQGTTSDDLHVAAKVLARIVVDKFQEALLEAIVERAAKQGLKALTRSRDALRGPQPRPSDGVADPTEAEPATVVQPDASEATSEPAVSDTATDVPAVRRRGVEPDDQGKPERPARARPQKRKKGVEAEEENAPALMSARSDDERPRRKGREESEGREPEDSKGARPRRTEPGADAAGDDPGTDRRSTSDTGVPSEPDPVVDAALSDLLRRRRDAAPVAPRVDRGTWEETGSVSVNTGGYAFPESKRWEHGHGWRSYEEGFNSMAPALARDIVGRDVRADAPGQRGYGTPSSQRTPRLKYQRGRAKGPLRRYPDAHLEVVEGTGAAARVSEVHHFEATTDTHFGRRSRKELQLSATAWISADRSRARYTDQTRFYYHIVSPDPPSATSVAFLNRLSAQYPGLEVSWFVMR